jgi:YD repeat-containing protein
MRLREREGTLMRGLVLALMCAAAAWGQVLPLDCGQSQPLNFSPTQTSFNLTFSGSIGETVLIRFIPIPGTITGQFGINEPVLVDQFGNGSGRRGDVPYMRKPDNAPIEIIGSPGARIGYHFDLRLDGTHTLQLTSANTAASATIQVVLTRINRPCTNAALSCGRSGSGSIPASAIGRMDTFQYPARGGDIIAFRLLRAASGGPIDTSTGFYMAVYGADGTVINAVQTNRLPVYPVAGRSDVTVPADGALTVVVWEATGLKGGVYYVGGTKLNGGCGGPALTCSSAIDGQLNTPLSFASYNVSAAAGDVYQFRVGRADISGSFTVAAEVYDAQGNRIGTVNAVSPGGHSAASAIVKFPASGAYSVLVSGPTDGSTGSFTIASTRINRPCTDTTISCSAILDDSVAGVVRNRVYSLTASAGDTFLVRLLQPDPRSLFKPHLEIVDANGTLLAPLSSTDLSRVNFTAPSNGAYTLLVTDAYDNGQSGNYTLSVMRLNRPCDATALSCGGVVAGNIARSLAAGVYTWNAAAGESFSVRMLGGAGGVLPSIEVYDPQGAPTGTAFSNASSGVDVVKPAAGAYTVIALDNNKTPSAGSYSMELLRTRNACAAALPQGQMASGVISATAPFAAYTLTATSGDSLALRSASSTPGFSAQMELYDPDGQRLDSGVFGLHRALSATGVYTVILGSATPRTAGGFAFTWQLMNNPAGTAPLPCGASLAGSLAGANQFRYYTTAADAGDMLRLRFTPIDSFAPQVELFDPNGVRIAANSDVLQKASVGGNYLVLVSPSTTVAETGSYTLAFQRPNRPCSATPLTCGQTTLKQVLSPGQLDAFSFNGTGGDLFTIRLIGRSGSYSPFAELYNSAGARMATSTTGQFHLGLPADGAYSVLVRDGGAINLGSYRVNLQDDSNTCSMDDKEAPTITLLRPTGGEVLSGGTTFRLQWVSDDNVGIASHDIALSTDSGKSFGTSIASGISGNAQAYDWILPGDIAPSRSAQVRITATDTAGNAQSVTSDLLTLIGSGFTPNASANYTYDSLNRLIMAALSDGRTVTWTWDTAGNLTQIAVSGQ